MTRVDDVCLRCVALRAWLVLFPSVFACVILKEAPLASARGERLRWRSTQKNESARRQLCSGGLGRGASAPPHVAPHPLPAAGKSRRDGGSGACQEVGVTAPLVTRRTWEHGREKGRGEAGRGGGGGGRFPNGRRHHHHHLRLRRHRFRLHSCCGCRRGCCRRRFRRLRPPRRRCRPRDAATTDAAGARAAAAAAMTGGTAGWSTGPRWAGDREVQVMNGVRVASGPSVVCDTPRLKWSDELPCI